MIALRPRPQPALRLLLGGLLLAPAVLLGLAATHAPGAKSLSPRVARDGGRGGQQGDPKRGTVVVAVMR